METNPKIGDIVAHKANLKIKMVVIDIINYPLNNYVCSYITKRGDYKTVTLTEKELVLLEKYTK